ncbi:hypothetical protein ABPG72_018596 [Tetrahymena utriculariae]
MSLNNSSNSEEENSLDFNSSSSDESEEDLQQFILSDSDDSSNSEIDDDNEDNDVFTWQEYSRKNKLDNMLVEYNEVSKYDKNLKSFQQPLDFFLYFLDEDTLNSICNSSDLYYKNNNKTNRAKTHHKQWLQPTISEIKNYIGILIYMGVIRKPQLRMYWKLEEKISQFSLKSYMTFERFMSIKTNFHLKYTNKKMNYLNNIKEFMKQLAQKFQTSYTPQQNLCIDESMIKFKGRTHMKVFMPLKPIRYGLKVYVLAESESGFLLNLSLHEGKNYQLVNLIGDLVDHYKNKGYIVAFDRFYTTTNVIQQLSHNGFYALGMCMKNRIKSNETITEKQKKIEKHESVFYVNKQKDLLLTIWRDTKVLNLITNFGNNSVETITRQQNESKISVNCPQIIKQYQSSSKGVDYLDQMIQYYNHEIRSKKWHNKQPKVK